MGKRPRIIHKPKGVLPEIDPMEFRSNKASGFVKFAEEFTRCINWNLWHDKHYLQRNQLGDDDGARSGIEIEIVNPFIVECYLHLLHYSSKLDKFKFIGPGNNGRGIGIVLRKSYDTDVPLNVVVEVYLDDSNQHEITVKTAMCVEEFKLHDGQFILNLIEGDHSVLSQFSKGRISEISNCQV